MKVMLGLLNDGSLVLLPSGRMGSIRGSTTDGDVDLVIWGDPDGAEFSPSFEVELFAPVVRGIH